MKSYTFKIFTTTNESLPHMASGTVKAESQKRAEALAREDCKGMIPECFLPIRVELESK